MGTNNEGVSPVVGVMLMLSVTVIIAAIVSAAAGGLSGTPKKAPSAVLDVRLYENRSYVDFPAHAMTIEHISGSPLQTRDLSIATYFRNESGQLLKGGLIGEKAVPVEGGTYCGALFINDQDRFEGSPVVASDAGRYRSWFGNTSAVLMAGDVLVTPAQFCSASPCHNYGLDAILGFDTLDPKNGYRAGDVVTVKIVHIPSGQVLFDKDVVVV